MKTVVRLFASISLALALQGCVGLVVDTATDAAIAVAKVPFKVGGAIVDVATDDEEQDSD